MYLSRIREKREKPQKNFSEILAFKGYNVWWDAELLPGDQFVNETTQVLKSAKVAVVLWSEMAVESSFVVHEATLAEGLGIFVPTTLYGTGVPENDERAAQLYLKACDGDHAPGCNDLAVMYDAGTGIPQSDARGRAVPESKR